MHNRQCEICGKSNLVNISSHMMQVHGTKFNDYKSTKYANIGISDTSKRNLSKTLSEREHNVDNNLTGNSNVIKQHTMTNAAGKMVSIKGEIHPFTGQDMPNYLSQNLALLRRFFAMTKERKRWYIKHDAPESFIRFLREGIAMIYEGYIECSEQFDNTYKEKLLSGSTTYEKVRKILAHEKVIGFVECMANKITEFLSNTIE